MATQRRTTESAGQDKAQQDEQAQPVQTDAAANVVAPADGPEHGYVGEAHPEKNRDDYTVAGVTGGTDSTGTKPPSTAADDVRGKWKPLSS